MDNITNVSNGSSSPSPRRIRGSAAIILAALVPAGFAGWLLWQAVSGPGDGGSATPGPAAAGSRSAGAEPPGALPDGGTPAPEPSKGASDGSPAGEAPRSQPPSGPLAGTVVVIDPGHNPGNREHVREIGRLVDIGTNSKECDNTGTASNAGYAEADFTLDVSRRIRTLLEKQGATVTLTQDGDRPYGPCVDERAEIGNKARADAVVSVHADGSAAGNRGFHMILPDRVRKGGADTSAIVRPSRELGKRIAGNFVRETGSPPSNYIGDGTGLDVRSDLGGLNLTEVPKVFIECGNMRDAQDVRRLTSAKWRQSAAQGIADGIESYLKSSAE